MPVIINKEPPDKDKVITMGKADKPVADYYPPGVTEPQVRPANVPAPPPPAEPEAPEKEEPEDKKAAKKK